MEAPLALPLALPGDVTMLEVGHSGLGQTTPPADFWVESHRRGVGQIREVDDDTAGASLISVPEVVAGTRLIVPRDEAHTVTPFPLIVPPPSHPNDEAPCADPIELLGAPNGI